MNGERLLRPASFRVLRWPAFFLMYGGGAMLLCPTGVYFLIGEFFPNLHLGNTILYRIAGVIVMFAGIAINALAERTEPEPPPAHSLLGLDHPQSSTAAK